MNDDTDVMSLEDEKALLAANAMTVDQQNYKYSIEARDRGVLSLARRNASIVPEGNKQNPEVVLGVVDSGSPVRRGRGLYGMHARRNRLAG